MGQGRLVLRVENTWERWMRALLAGRWPALEGGHQDLCAHCAARIQGSPETRLPKRPKGGDLTLFVLMEQACRKCLSDECVRQWVCQRGQGDCSGGSKKMGGEGTVGPVEKAPSSAP